MADCIQDTRNASFERTVISVCPVNKPVWSTLTVSQRTPSVQKSKEARARNGTMRVIYPCRPGPLPITAAIDIANQCKYI